MAFQARIGEQVAKLFLAIKEDNKGNFLYAEFVDRSALRGIAGVASSLDGMTLDGPARSQRTGEKIPGIGANVNVNSGD
ncbi:hypothetical protein [Collimonas sp.]|uniref:hypothetical protein n=1 Tax=Collimonas sp. TaxID=1963772 RepID=UPI0037BF10B6